MTLSKRKEWLEKWFKKQIASKKITFAA